MPSCSDSRFASTSSASPAALLPLACSTRRRQRTAICTTSRATSRRSRPISRPGAPSETGRFYFCRTQKEAVVQHGTAWPAPDQRLGLCQSERAECDVEEQTGPPPDRSSRSPWSPTRSATVPTAAELSSIRSAEPVPHSIAAERTGRRARLIEIDPHFVDITIERWQRLTGGIALHADSAQPFVRSCNSSAGSRPDHFLA